MLFFKKILESKKPEAPTDRRVAARYAVLPGFPLKTVLNIAGRDDLGELLKGEGMDWTGKLINLSATGARVQMPRTMLAQRGDPCRLKLDMQGYELVVPGTIAHVTERRDSLVFGLTLNLAASGTAAAFRQLVELVALGSTLKQVKPLQPDESGYMAEQYAGEPESRLIVWRQLAGREVAAFEFQLKDCVVRGLAGRAGLECFTGTEGATRRPASGVRGEEILRLYQWVVLNLAPELPTDVRTFLLQHAA
ncbi:PilZ domain protein [Lacunisphaera limnophila]|uniref:PilZ domain protein n=1 Tax=Lacunisphaera limnophila TaxID=1838286 RepID=A0A1D8AUX8_9BACT|nr:PilZ domain-containing protein [Lacunisphaera limnophila]AOS44700.1 PilZ domain protein [Lacunisphaera limnophila]